MADTFAGVELPNRLAFEETGSALRERVVAYSGVDGGESVFFGLAPIGYVFRGYLRVADEIALSDAKAALASLEGMVGTLDARDTEHQDCRCGVFRFSGYQQLAAEDEDSCTRLEFYEVEFLQLYRG